MIIVRGQDQYHIDFAAGQLWRVQDRGREEIHLTPKAWAVLEYLSNRRMTLVRKDELLNEIWGVEEGYEASLGKVIRELRAALDDNPENPAFIETVHARGYRFIAEKQPAENEVGDSNGRPIEKAPPGTSKPAAADSRSAPTASVAPWSLRGIRLGLSFGVLEKGGEKAICLSAKFEAALRNIVLEMSEEVFVEVFDNLALLCLRAILRVHPGGDVYEEDLKYVANEVSGHVLDSVMRRAASYNLFAGDPEAGFSLSEDFKNEFADVFMAEEDATGDRRLACARALTSVCESAALAKGDSDPSNAKMAMFGLSMYMRGTGMMNSFKTDGTREPSSHQRS